jgi:hypothetical protein
MTMRNMHLDYCLAYDYILIPVTFEDIWIFWHLMAEYKRVGGISCGWAEISRPYMAVRWRVVTIVPSSPRSVAWRIMYATRPCPTVWYHERHTNSFSLMHSGEEKAMERNKTRPWCRQNLRFGFQSTLGFCSNWIDDVLPIQSPARPHSARLIDRLLEVLVLCLKILFILFGTPPVKLGSLSLDLHHTLAEKNIHG